MTTPILLGIILSWPLPVARAAEPRPVGRDLCGATLGMTAEALTSRLQAQDVTADAARSLNPGERAFEFPDRLRPLGASACRGFVFEGRLWRLEATYAPAFTKSTPWEPFLRGFAERYGEPRRSQSKQGDTLVQHATWKDAGALMTCTRDLRAQPPEKSRRPYYYVTVEIPLERERVRQGPAPAPSRRAGAPPPCSDHASCRERAEQRLRKGDCSGAIGDWNQALAFKPEDARSLYRRGLAKKKRGDTAGAAADYARAAASDPSLRDKDDGQGGPKDDLGPTVTCRK